MVTLARSKAGHDKNHVYLVIKEDAEFVYLVNGTTKKLDHPKKKKKFHVQLIKQMPPELWEGLEESQDPDDIIIAKMLDNYHRRK